MEVYNFDKALWQRVQEIKVNQTGSKQNRTEQPEIFEPGIKINLSAEHVRPKQNI